jgi:hypothetical protein
LGSTGNSYHVTKLFLHDQWDIDRISGDFIANELFWNNAMDAYAKFPSAVQTDLYPGSYTGTLFPLHGDIKYCC